MTETLIELAIPALPALAIGYVAGIPTDAEADTWQGQLRWALTWFTVSGVLEVLGALGCRAIYRIGLLMF